MTNYFITRHKGAEEWSARQGLDVTIIDHMGSDILKKIEPDDKIMGNIPISMVALANQRGGRYFNLNIDLPKEKRGVELTANELELYGARLDEYSVIHIGKMEKIVKKKPKRKTRKV